MPLFSFDILLFIYERFPRFIFSPSLPLPPVVFFVLLFAGDRRARAAAGSRAYAPRNRRHRPQLGARGLDENARIRFTERDSIQKQLDVSEPFEKRGAEEGGGRKRSTYARRSRYGAEPIPRERQTDLSRDESADKSQPGETNHSRGETASILRVRDIIFYNGGAPSLAQSIGPIDHRGVETRLELDSVLRIRVFVFFRSRRIFNFAMFCILVYTSSLAKRRGPFKASAEIRRFHCVSLRDPRDGMRVTRVPLSDRRGKKGEAARQYARSRTNTARNESSFVTLYNRRANGSR